jgi:hypothetical protein
MICSGGEYINNGSQCSKICKAGVCIECESDSDCGANASCQSGSCVFSTPVCTPGDKSCDGNNVKTCNPDGKGYTSSPCNGTCTGKGICQETTQQECTPNALRCNGKTLESCNASGKWESKTVCAVMCSNNACIDCIDGSKSVLMMGKKYSSAPMAALPNIQLAMLVKSVMPEIVLILQNLRHVITISCDAIIIPLKNAQITVG